MKEDNNNFSPEKVTPAMRRVARNWNRWASGYSKWFQREFNKIRAGQVTEDDLKKQFVKCEEMGNYPVQSTCKVGNTNSHNRSNQYATGMSNMHT